MKRNNTSRILRTAARDKRGAALLFLLVAAVVLTLMTPASAQYRRQTLEVQGGWNAVHLEVDPVESSCAALIARHEGKIEAIWTYDNRYAAMRAFDPAEFRDDLETPPVRVENRWRVYHPGHVELSNLHHLRGARAYLLRVRDGEAPFSVEVFGRPVPDDGFWVADGYSLRGLSIDSGLEGHARPTFAEYFAGSLTHIADSNGVFSMDLAGQMQGPLDLASTRIESGRAYWIHTAGVSQYRGPVEIEQVPREGLDFGLDLVEARLTLRNRTAEPNRVTLRLLGTSTEPPAGEPAWAGNVPLRYFDIQDGVRRWVTVDDTGIEIEVPASGTRQLRLAVDRKGLAPAEVREPLATVAEGGAGGLDDAGSSYQGELELRTQGGFRKGVSMTAESGDHGGLWVGEVSLRHVRRVQRAAPTGAVPYPGTFRVGSYPKPSLEEALTPPPTPEPTLEDPNPQPEFAGFPDIEGRSDDVPEMSFPLILHVGEDTGDKKKLTLLRQVALMWQREGTRDGGAPVSGSYVLMTRDGLRDGLLDRKLDDDNPRFVGGTLKDGRRFSYLKTAPTVPADTVLVASGATSESPGGDFSGLGSGDWEAVIDQSPHDPLNPYIHRYHPDHGHPKIMRQAGVPARGGIEVKTTVRLTFDDALDTGGADPREGEFDTAGGVLVVPERPGYGTKILTGTYREVIEKLSYDVIVVQGSFEIHLVVGGIDELNAGI